MSILPVGIGSSGADVGDIQNSLRFRGNSYLQKTAATSATSTYFACVKRGKLGVISPIFDSNIKFNANGTLTAFGLTTTAVFRDPTAWLLIHVSNGGLYVNGVSHGAVTTSAITNCRIGYDGTNYFDGCMARVCILDGTSSAYTNWMWQNTEINEWIVKPFSSIQSIVSAGGAAGIMLEFLTSTLGTCSASKTAMTSTGHSTSAGTSCDWPCKDVPGNSFATLNPIYPSASGITNGNLTASTTAVRGTQQALSYDCRWEVTAGGSAVTAGVISSTGATNTTTVTANKTFAFRLTAAGALDYKNVTDAGSWTSITTGLSGEQYPYGTTAAATWNFGQIPLHASATLQNGAYFYDTTSGYSALCQANLTDPAILNPKKHFDVVTRTGTAATYSVTSIGFQPDFVWVKSRGRAVDHALYDSVRGVQKRLETNNTDAEVTGDSTGLTAFNSDGYTGGALDQINGTTATNSFVDCLWKANGAGVSNTDGSITSTVSANQKAGFSIVTYTGNAIDNATFGHGLGTTPAMVIIKSRNPTAAERWNVWHKSLAAETYFLGLNETAAVYTALTNRQKSHSSTRVTLGNNSEVNENTKNFVAYCFAEIPGYSKFGSYTGNGSADGPFVHCGFKPRYVLIKQTTVASSTNWEVMDTARDTYNQAYLELYPNSSSAENASSADEMDILSSGFKLRSTNGIHNTSSGTYIFAAFADVPGKFSNAR